MQNNADSLQKYQQTSAIFIWFSASKVYMDIKGVTVIHSSNSNNTIICFL